MKIKDGGQTERMGGAKIEEITIKAPTNDYSRTFELWVNDSSLSYLTIDEMLDLKEEINRALKSLLL